MAAQSTSPATHRLLGFLQQRGLLDVDHPDTPAHPTHWPRQTGVAELDAERRRRHHQTAIAAVLNELPELTATHLNAWIRVLRGEGRRRHRPVDYLRIRRYLNIALPVLRSWAAAGLDLRQITDTHIRHELGKRQGSRARDLHHVLCTLFAALKQERLTFYNPMVGISLTTPVRVPVPLPSDRLRGLLDNLDDPRDRLAVALVDIHGLRPVEVTRLQLDDLDLTRLKIHVPRAEHVHVTYLDAFTLELCTAWLTHRQRRWPTSPNPHLLISSQTAHHPARPPLSYCGLRAVFDKIGILPKRLWSDRILHEAKLTADPVQLVRLFGIHPNTAVKYVNAAHPDKALPRIH